MTKKTFIFELVISILNYILKIDFSVKEKISNFRYITDSDLNVWDIIGVGVYVLYYITWHLQLGCLVLTPM